MKKSKQAVEYVVTVHFVIDLSGVPVNLSVLKSSSSDELDNDALDAVKQYRFTPALLEGKPAAVNMNVEVHFLPLKRP